MKERSKKVSWKEEEFKYFFHRKLLTRPEVKITSELEVIREWVITRGGRPVKATHIRKKNTSIDLIEIAFIENQEDFFKPISWEEWYTVFNKNQLRFIYIEKTSNGKDSRFYKLCQ